MTAPPVSLYIHIPYCSRKCPYCDFNTYGTPRMPEREYVAALISEFHRRILELGWEGRPLRTAYFGGGTPSLLGAESIAALMGEFRSRLESSAIEEVTVECNPAEIDYEKLAGFGSAGVTRVSLGGQSFNPRILKLLGRWHTADDVVSSVDDARRAGISNISVDLIFGVPEQTQDELSGDMDRIEALDVPHVSAYELTFERGTPFFASLARGTLGRLDEERVTDLYELLTNRLATAGLARYEISNYARASFESKHNRGYWTGIEYLGLGAGSHSMARLADAPSSYARRWANLANPDRYMEAATGEGTISAWSETISRETAGMERLMTLLRMREGIIEEEFTREFPEHRECFSSERLEPLISGDLARRTTDGITLTPRGLLLHESVVMALLGTS